jgi:serine/threonine protein kinase
LTRVDQGRRHDGPQNGAGARNRPQGSYTERDAAGIVRTVLKVLEYAHDLGVAHRWVQLFENK